MSTGPLRLLVIPPFVPYPPTDGQRVRTWNLTSRLAEHHSVTLATWVPAGTPAAHIEPVAGAVEHLLTAPMGPAPMRSQDRARRWAEFYAAGRPPYVGFMLEERRVGARALGAEIRRLHEAAPFDAMVLEEEAMAFMPLPRLGIPTVLHRLNCFTRAVGDIDPPRRWRHVFKPVEDVQWPNYDRRCTEAADLLIATTPESAAELQRLSPTRTFHVVSNGVDLPATPLRPSQGTDLVFVGWMRYPPNADAVAWFVREVWPSVRSQVPGCRLRIVGRDPAPSVSVLAADDVIVTGEVPDVVAACRGARAALATLRAGMGIKNKTLEGMAMGLPVLATSPGAEGISAAGDDGLFVSDDAQALAEHAVRLLRHPELADELGARARARVAREFDWSALATTYGEILAEGIRSVD